MLKKIVLLAFLLLGLLHLQAQRVDYSVVSVQEEKGIDFVQITTSGDYVHMPVVKRSWKKVDWSSNRVLDISVDGKNIAYLSSRNNTTNIFIKELSKQGSSIQRTNRSEVLDFSFSPDGKYICFSEKRGNTTQIFQTDAENGYVCRQITSGSRDNSPIYTPDMQQIFFSRLEKKGVSIWSYNIQDNFLSTYTSGMNSYPIPDTTSSFICARISVEGRSEIWKINYETGIEECLISDRERNFTSPVLSPDGKWILFVGSTKITSPRTYFNTDIFVAQIDGINFHQITYHAADDLSPVWSKDGKYIYFISQRGSLEGAANIWRMNFNFGD